MLLLADWVSQVPPPGPTNSSWTDVVESIATAVGAVATAATLIFLLLQLRTQQSQTALQSEATEATRLQKRRHEASLVSVYMRRGEETSTGVIFDYEVKTASDTPLYFVFFEVVDGNTLRFRRLGELRGPKTGRIELGSQYRDFTESDPAKHTWPYFRITFMDNANVFWMRDIHGSLQETSEGFPPLHRERMSLAEYRAYNVSQQTPQCPLLASHLVDVDDMWRDGGTARWLDDSVS